MMSDPALFTAVDFIGGHSVEQPADLKPGKPMYDTEGYHTTGSDAGAASWITELNTRYILYNQSANLAWNLITAYYEGTSFWPHGLMHAFQPWSGWFSVPASIWATAHYTQFTSIRRGWHYSLVDPASGGSGLLAQGGSYVSLLDDSTGDWTLVVEKMPGDAGGPGGTVAPETATFSLGGRFALASTLAVWSTLLAVGGTPSVDPSQQFERLADVKVTGGAFSVNVSVGQILTVTTLTSAGNKGSFAPSPPPAAFPSEWSDDFSGCAVDGSAKYLTDLNGVLTCADSGDPSHGIVVRQVVPKAPIRWWTDTRPHSVIGDYNWADVAASVDFRCTADGGSAMVGARASLNGRTDADGISAEDELAGLWFSVLCAGGANGDGPAQWALWPSAKSVSSAGGALLSGAFGAPVPAGAWHTLRLVVNGTRVQGFFDGDEVFYDAEVGAKGPASGWVGVGTAAWVPTEFDNIAISATSSRCSSAGAAGGAVAVWPCNAAAAGQRWLFSNASASPPFGTLSLQGVGGGHELCLAVSPAKNQYGSPTVVIEACAAAQPPPPAQLWAVNGNGTVTTLGAPDFHPGATLCLDVSANDYSPGSQLDVFPCQASANQQWRVSAEGLLSSGDPLGFFCAGAC